MPSPTGADREVARADREAELDLLVERFAEDLAAAIRSVVEAAIAATGFLTLAAAGESPAVDTSHLAAIRPGVAEAADSVAVKHYVGIYQQGALTGFVSTEKGEQWMARQGDTVVESVTNTRGTMAAMAARNQVVGLADDAYFRVATTMATAIDQGWTLDQRQDALRPVLDGLEVRARTVARTEGTRAYNRGASEVVDLLGEDAPGWKEWLATRDPRTRDDHWLADGQVVRVDSVFMVGGHPLRYPGDENAPASQTVNCRCTLLLLDEPPDGWEDPDGPVAAATPQEPPPTPAPEDAGDAAEPDADNPELADLRMAQANFQDMLDAAGGWDAVEREVSLRHWRRAANTGQVESRIRFLEDQVETDERLLDLLRSITDQERAQLRRNIADARREAENLRGLLEAPLEDNARAVELLLNNVGHQANEVVLRRLRARGIDLDAPFKADLSVDPAPLRAALEDLEARFEREAAMALDQGDDELIHHYLQRVARDVEERRRASQEWWDLKRQLLHDVSAPTAPRDLYAQELRALLREVRGEAAERAAYTESGSSWSIKDRQIVAECTESYPPDWVRLHNARSDAVRTMDFRPTDGRCGHLADDYITFPDNSHTDGYRYEVTVHEFAHRMENVVPGVKPMEAAFWQRRAGGEVAEQLVKKLPGYGYGPQEVAIDDHFADPYIGKTYVPDDQPGMTAAQEARAGRTNWELLSMGTQTFLSPMVDRGTWESWGRRAWGDLDYRAFINGALFAL